MKRSPSWAASIFEAFEINAVVRVVLDHADHVRGSYMGALGSDIGLKMQGFMHFAKPKTLILKP
jgi:hypothetical protein